MKGLSLVLNLTFTMMTIASILPRISSAVDGICGTEDSKCPRGWRLFNAEKCILVESYERDYVHAVDRCQSYNAELLNTIDISNSIAACLKGLLQNKPAKIWLQSDTSNLLLTVFDLQRNTQENVSLEGIHEYACIRKRGKNPAISLAFSIQENSEGPVTNLGDVETYNVSLPQTLICKDLEGASVVMTLKERNGKKNNTTSGSIISSRVSTDKCHEHKLSFVCEAGNGFTKANRSLDLRITCPTILSFTTSLANTASGSSSNHQGNGNNYMEGDNVRFNCATVDSRKYNTTITKKHSTSTMQTLTSVTCSDMGTYVCEATQNGDKKDQKEVDIGIHGCEPQLCPGEKKGAEISDSTTVIPGICVLAFPQLNDKAIFNGMEISREHSGSQDFGWNYKNATDFSSYIVTFEIYNISSLKYKEQLNITLKTSDGNNLTLSYKINHFNDPDPGDATPTSTTTEKPLQDTDTGLSTLSAGLLVVVVVITIVVASIFFILGMIVYRFRRKLFRRHERPMSLATLNSYNSHKSTNDDAERYSAVNVYANLAHTGTLSQENSLVGNDQNDRYQSYRPVPMQPQPANVGNYLNTKEAVNLISTVNVYANLGRPGQSHPTEHHNTRQIPEEEPLCPENSEDIYNNMRLSATDNPDSGRYISEDGLVYVTVAHRLSSHGGHPSSTPSPVPTSTPTKAFSKTDPAVHYASLDYKKSGKHSAKKWKRKQRFSLTKL